MRIDEKRVAENLSAARNGYGTQALLLALARKGLARREAYRLVQRRAHEALEEGKDLEELLVADGEVREHLSAEEILNLQRLVRRVPVSDDVVSFAVRLVRATRPRSDDAPQFVKDWVSWGAGPRASQFLILGAKTRAILDGRYTPLIDDVKFVARAVLRHRIVTNFNAEAEGVDPVDIADRLVEHVAPVAQVIS